MNIKMLFKIEGEFLFGKSYVSVVGQIMIINFKGSIFCVVWREKSEITNNNFSQRVG